MGLMQPKDSKVACTLAANLSKISERYFVSPCHSEDWSFSPRLNKTFDVGALTGEFLFPILGETRILWFVGPTFRATHVSSKNVHNFRLKTCQVSWYLMAIAKRWYPKGGTLVESMVGIIQERSCWSCYVLAVSPPSRIRSEIGRRASGIVIDCLPLSRDFIRFGMVGRKHYLLGGQWIAAAYHNIVIIKTNTCLFNGFIDLCT